MERILKVTFILQFLFEELKQRELLSPLGIESLSSALELLLEKVGRNFILDHPTEAKKLEEAGREFAEESISRIKENAEDYQNHFLVVLSRGFIGFLLEQKADVASHLSACHLELTDWLEEEKSASELRIKRLLKAANLDCEADQRQLVADICLN